MTEAFVPWMAIFREPHGDGTPKRIYPTGAWDICFDDERRTAITGWGRVSQTESHARLIAAACNSYRKHCGPDAVQFSEGDLLGEALAVCEMAFQCSSGLTTSSPSGLLHEAARDVLTKATGDHNAAG